MECGAQDQILKGAETPPPLAEPQHRQGSLQEEDTSFYEFKYTKYPWSLQTNLFIGGQCTFVIGLWGFHWKWDSSEKNLLNGFINDLCVTVIDICWSNETKNKK